MSDEADRHIEALMAEDDSIAEKAAALGRGALQGATLGFGDELAGVWHGLTGSLYPGAPSFGSQYTQGRDAERQANAAAEAKHPWLYGTGQVGGGLAPVLATGGMSALPVAMAEGAISGVGSSDASSPEQLLRDAGSGLLVGTALGGVGAGLGKAFSRLGSKAAQKASAAAARADEIAAQEVAALEHNAARRLGGETQKGFRTMEFFQHFFEMLTPAQQAAYKAKLLQSGEGQKLIQSIADNYLESAPQQLSKIAGKKAALEALAKARPQTIAERAAELKKPSIMKDIGSLVKSYREGPAAAMATHAIGLPGLEAAAGLAFSRTRMGKAIANRVNRPGNQIATWNALKALAEAGKPAARFAPAALVPAEAAAMIPAAVTPPAKTWSNPEDAAIDALLSGK